MRARLIKFGHQLTAGLWFVPAICVAIAIALAVGAIAIDRHLAASGTRTVVPFVTSAGSARAVLSTIAGSLLGVMGTVLSMTVIILMLASTQFNPRALHTFTRDRGLHVVIGIFTGTFMYSVMVLHVVRDKDEGIFIPATAIAGAIVLALAGVGALIYFTHHIATVMQVSNVIASLSRTAGPLLDLRFPTRDGGGHGTLAEGDPRLPGPPEGARFRPVPSPSTGYVQVLDVAGLVRLAARHEAIVRVERPVGMFAAEGQPIASISGAVPDESLAAAVARCFAFGEYRLIEQDPEFALLQIADMTIKALAGGVNDPTTATTSLDYLFAALARIAPRADPAPYYGDGGGRLRVIAPGASFASLVDTTIGHVVQKLGNDAPVILRLLDGLADVARATTDPARHVQLQELANRAAAAATRDVQDEKDRADIAKRTWVVGGARS